jgi:hypothetical protein
MLFELYLPGTSKPRKRWADGARQHSSDPVDGPDLAFEVAYHGVGGKALAGGALVDLGGP